MILLGSAAKFIVAPPAARGHVRRFGADRVRHERGAPDANRLTRRLRRSGESSVNFRLMRRTDPRIMDASETK